jgi:hypothetical protein
VRGADGVRDKVAELLAVEMPRKIPLLREAWDLDAAGLPDLDVITSGEAADNTLDSRGRSWVEVINPRLLRTRRVDIDPAGRPVYRSRYAARIYVWALGQDWGGAKTARDNLAAAVRLSLIEYPTLTILGGDTGWLLHEDTITEEYGEPQRINRRSTTGPARVWAGAVLSYEIDAEESTADGSTRPPLGVNNDMIITPHGYGPGVPFPVPEETP